MSAAPPAGTRVPISERPGIRNDPTRPYRHLGRQNRRGRINDMEVEHLHGDSSTHRDLGTVVADQLH